ncbi:NACHT domain-containing protein [Pseudarthrobacter sp. TAF60_1]|uniref:NACHT domain-containing protein n=1 Tax=Pseudarthrobacter sp. TAF60_1 TaxID=3233071 RepID=UPI003F97F4CC
MTARKLEPPDQLRLPILVRCDQLHAHANSSIEEICVDVLAVAKNQSSALAAWLINHLQTAENILLLDALDEIPGNVASLPLGQKLERWADRSSPGRVIISSRIAGYERPQGLMLTEVELQPFSPVDVGAYVDAWGLDQQSRARIHEELKTPSFMGLARTPLLLAFICSVASQPESLPRRRRELYDRMLDQLLGEHHRRRRQATDPLGHPECHPGQG